MEELQTLEQKVQALIEKYRESSATIENLRQELAQVKEDKQRTEQKLEQAENQLLSYNQASEKLDTERENTKQVVDELVSNIDAAIHEDASNG